MTDFTEPRFDHPPRSMAQRVGAVAWPSFFAACVCTMVFFAFVDPLALRDITWPELSLSRQMGSSLFTWILLRPASRFNRPLPPER